MPVVVSRKTLTPTRYPSSRPRDPFTRPRALRRAVRLPHEGHEVVGHARPHGGDRAARGDLPGRRPAGHQHVPARHVRGGGAADRGRVVREGTPVRTHRGARRDEGVHRRRDGGRGDEGRPRAHDRHHRWAAGDRPGHEDPDRSRRRGDRRGPHLSRRRAGLLRLRSRCRADRDGRRRDARGPARGDARGSGARRAPAQVHLHGADVPEPGRRDYVAAPPAAAGRDRARARGLLVREPPPSGLRRKGGDPPPPLHALDGGLYVMYLGTFSKILSPGIRLGWVVAPPPVLEKINLGKQGADLCTSTLSQLMVQAYFERAPWRDYVDSLTEVYRDRRDAMLDALADHFPPQAEWTRPGGGLFIWATLPDFIDTTDLLARALRENVAFVPGSAAFLDGRGHSSMRLNFSASDGESIREGIRRIGEVVTEQVNLYGTITGEHQAVTPPGAEVVQIPTPAERSRRAR